MSGDGTSYVLIIQLLNKAKYSNFVLQELLSLLRLADLVPQEVLSMELKRNGVSPNNLATVTGEELELFPFVRLELSFSLVERLTFSLSRGVGIGRFGWLLVQSANREEPSNLQVISSELLCEETQSLKTFGFVVLGAGMTLSSEQQRQKIESLPIEPFKGKCDLTSPDRVFVLCELYRDEKLIYKCLFKELRSLLKRKSYITKYLLSERYFLGPTTTDAELSFMMINQGGVKKGSFILDPFVGTAGILIAASHFGAFCYGFEIDIRVILGYKVGRVNQQSTYKFESQNSSRPNIFTNFDQYGLVHPEILRCDSSNFYSRFSCFFDAVICDPPYGKRASARESRKKESDSIPMPKNSLNSRIIPTDVTENESLTKKLIENFCSYLRPGGKLVFLYPCEGKVNLKTHFNKYRNYKLISISENPISGQFSRYLITLERL